MPMGAAGTGVAPVVTTKHKRANDKPVIRLCSSYTKLNSQQMDPTFLGLCSYDAVQAVAF